MMRHVTIEQGRMEIILAPDAASACREAAARIAAHVRATPEPVLGLATGRTMEAIYRALVGLHRDEGLSFARCRTFNLDEYHPIAPDDPRSYHAYMRAALFRHVDIAPERTRLPDGAAADQAGECRAYEEAIRAAGGIGLQLLGIGLTGHIGFNEPPSDFASRTRLVELDETTRRQNAELFDNRWQNVPRQALTMGVGTIMEARRLLLVATGAAKARIVRDALEGPVTPMVSASALRLHPACTVVLDPEAAELLDLA
ncbi:glucosamine-6-phosphate deaminase [Gluconacetobacter sacchari]|uniref:glucosamine-6-phosphate deaminase n=1 Tax=Gluconacetobacter sacchari TaxID=92759 RepID=UPI0039B5C3B2